MAVSITENMYTSSQKPIQLPRAAYMETSATTLIKAGINEFCVSLNPKLGDEGWSLLTMRLGVLYLEKIKDHENEGI